MVIIGATCPLAAYINGSFTPKQEKGFVGCLVLNKHMDICACLIATLYTAEKCVLSSSMCVSKFAAATRAHTNTTLLPFTITSAFYRQTCFASVEGAVHAAVMARAVAGDNAQR